MDAFSTYGILSDKTSGYQGCLRCRAEGLRSLVGGTCVVRYDNESGKGDHRHFNTRERPYTFETPEQLIADFQADMARWNRENRHS